MFDDRKLRQQICAFASANGFTAAVPDTLSLLALGGSDRRFYRVVSNKTSCIAMVSPASSDEQLAETIKAEIADDLYQAQQTKEKKLRNQKKQEIFASVLDKGSKGKELDTYITLLLLKVIAMPYMRKDKAVIFGQEFEEIYMEFFQILCY